MKKFLKQTVTVTLILALSLIICSCSFNNKNTDKSTSKAYITDNEISSVKQTTSKQNNKNYFDDAIFIGNSVLNDMHNYTKDILKSTFYSVDNLSVNNIYDKKFVEINGKKITAIEAIKSNNKFTKVYIMLGTNEMAWPYLNVFIDEYKKIIKEIRTKNPNAEIYIMSVLPVTEKHSKANSDENNTLVKKINNYIIKMTKQENLIYLDLASKLCENGVLPEYASFDGVHPGKKFSVKWANYIKSNISDESNN